MGSISRDATFKVYFDSIRTTEYPITGKPMDFTTEFKEKVIRDVVS